MISPWTPPGTKVVALKSWRAGSLVVDAGCVYTVVKIVEAANAGPGYRSPFGAHLAECDHSPQSMGWYFGVFCVPIETLRRLDIPDCLTELLQSKPVDAPREVERVG